MIFFYFEIPSKFFFIAESFFAWRKMAVSRRLMWKADRRNSHSAIICCSAPCEMSAQSRHFMLPNVMLHARSLNPLRKSLLTERTWCAITTPVVRHYVGLAPQSSSTDNARYSMADPADKGPRNTINSVTSGKCLLN